MGKVVVHVFISDYTISELETLRTKVQAFMDSEPNAKLLTFSYTEEEST